MEINEPQENYITGYIKIYRSVINHWLLITNQFSKFEAWMWLLIHANFKDNKVNLGFELFEIKRGQFITSQEKLADKWGWNRNQVRSFLELLQKDKMIIAETSTRFTKITICNYDTYQFELPTTQQRMDNDTTTDGQRLDNDWTQISNVKNVNNVKNDKNINNETELLNSQIWHEQTSMALKIEPSEIIEWVQKFINEVKAKEQFSGRPLRDLKSHCISWIKSEISKQKKGYGVDSWLNKLSRIPPPLKTKINVSNSK